MKTYKKILLAIFPILIIAGGLVYRHFNKPTDQLVGTIITAPAGGTGIGSAVPGDVGSCLKVNASSPFTYTLGTCGSGGSSSVFKGVSVTNNLGTTYTHVGSFSFEPNMFSLTNVASQSLVRLNWTNGPASRSAQNTWTALNTFNSTGLSIQGTSASLSVNFEALGYASIGNPTASNSFSGSLLVKSGIYGKGTASISGTVYARTTSNSTTVPALVTGANANASDYAWSFAGGRVMIGYDVNDVGAAFGVGAGKGIKFYTNGTSGTFLSGTKVLSLNVSSGASFSTPIEVTGAASISGRFDLFGNASVSDRFELSNGTTGVHPVLRLNNSGAFAASEPAIDFTNSSAPLTQARISSVPGASFNASILKFAVANSSRTLVERMRIDQNGNVGINTILPTTTLAVSGTASVSGLALFNSAASISTNFEVGGYASIGNPTASNSFTGSLNISKGLKSLTFQGANLTECIGSNKLLWSAGNFSCAADATGTGMLIKDDGALNLSAATRLNFANNAFTLVASGTTESIIKIDWTNGPASKSGANTWTGVNKFNLGASISPNLEVYGTGPGLGGVASISRQLNVGGFSVLSGAVAQIASSANNFVQLNVQNFSNGASASGDIVVTADDGNNSGRFIDLGIDSSTFKDWRQTLTGFHDAYLMASVSNLVIAVASNSSTAAIKFGVGNGLTSNFERFRILSTGASFSAGTNVEFGGYASISNSATSFLKIPYNTYSINVAGQVILNSASNSLDRYDGTSVVVDRKTSTCFTFIVDSPTASNPGFVGPRMFDDPFTITSVAEVASGTNSATWNLQYGAPNTFSTAVFTNGKKASTASNPIYTSSNYIVNSTIADGQGLEVKISSRSATLQSFSVNVCGRYTH